MKILTTNYDGHNSAGFGSILQIVQHLHAYSKINNHEYLFSGFKNLSHYQYTNDTESVFTEKLNNFINMTNLPDGKVEFIDDNYLIKIWGEEYRTEKKSHIKELFYKLNYNDEVYFQRGKENICIHIRNINPKDNCFDAGREYFNEQKKEFYINLVNKITNKEYEKYDIHVFSQGNESDFHFLKSLFNAKLHINDDLVKTFYHLVISENFITSNSSLSWSAHLFGKNKKVYGRNNFFHSWYPETILIDKKGNII